MVASRIVCVYQAQFLPRLHYLNRIANSDVLVLLDEAQLQGRTGNGWEKRTHIKVDGERFLLTVPVHGRQKPIRECKVAYDMGWPEKALKTLEHEYKREPFFDEWYAYIKDLFIASSESLFDYNVRILRWIVDALGIDTEIRLQSEFEYSERKGELMRELTQQAGGTMYHCGAWEIGRYLMLDDFARAGIDVLVQNWVCPEYSQGSGAFLPNLSVVDALFRCGTNGTKKLLKG